MWLQIRKGYQSFDAFLGDGVKFALKGLKIKHKFEQEVGE